MTPAHPTITILGGGNMGSSLIGGLMNDGHPSHQLWASEPNDERRHYLQDKFDIHTTSHNTEAVESADVVIIAVKPQIFASVAEEIKAIIQRRKPLVISIAAGVRETSIQQYLGGHLAIVRAMPNTPALIGCGATALYANDFVTPEQRNLAESMLRAVGLVVWLPQEALMDVVTALSGSGPAYFFMVMEALQQAAQELGLPEETARLLTLQTALGASRMAMESGKPLTELRHQVTSPGGTTEKGVAVLEENQVHALFKKVLQAAKLRSEELANLMKEKT